MTTLRRRCFNWQASLDGRTRIVLLAFILVAVQPLLIGELSVLLSSHKHSTVVGIVSGFVILAAILAVLLVALVRRRRWAWLVLAFLFSVAVILDVLKFNGVVTLVRDVVGLALLVSPPMRRYVNRANAPDRRQGAAAEGPRAG
jgi:hypothetical protein